MNKETGTVLPQNIVNGRFVHFISRQYRHTRPDVGRKGYIPCYPDDSLPSCGPWDEDRSQSPLVTVDCCMYSFTREKTTFFNMAVTKSDLDPEVRKIPITFNDVATDKPSMRS